MRQEEEKMAWRRHFGILAELQEKAEGGNFLTYRETMCAIEDGLAAIKNCQCDCDLSVNWICVLCTERKGLLMAQRYIKQERNW